MPACRTDNLMINRKGRDQPMVLRSRLGPPAAVVASPRMVLAPAFTVAVVVCHVVQAPVPLSIVSTRANPEPGPT
jgi:hypothetical protein